MFLSQGAAGPESQCSYCRELAGLYAIIRTIRLVTKFYHLESGSVEVGYDSQSALDRLLSDHSWVLVAASQELLQDPIIEHRGPSILSDPA